FHKLSVIFLLVCLKAETKISFSEAFYSFEHRKNLFLDGTSCETAVDLVRDLEAPHTHAVEFVKLINEIPLITREKIAALRRDHHGNFSGVNCFSRLPRIQHDVVPTMVPCEFVDLLNLLLNHRHVAKSPGRLRCVQDAHKQGERLVVNRA